MNKTKPQIMQAAKSTFQIGNQIKKNSAIIKSKSAFIRKLLVIAGVPIDHLTMDEAVDRIDQFVQQGRLDGRTRQVATVNADFVVKAAEDPELRFILQGVDLSTPDGISLVWGARLLGVDIRERVTGADLVPTLAAHAAKKGYSIYLFGSGEGVAEKAAEILIHNNPGLKIVGKVSPPFSSVIEMEEKLIDDIKQAKPDILLVALGNPKQEKFIAMHKIGLGVPVAIGIGGALDLITGKTRRAPQWMQRIGIEWFYRMCSDPKRLVKRYFKDLVGFTSFLVSQWFHMKTNQKADVLLPRHEIILLNGKAIVQLSGRIDATNNSRLLRLLDQALAETAEIEIDFTHVVFLDSIAIGTILASTRTARDQGGDIRLINLPPSIERTLKLLKLDRFFELEFSTNSSRPIAKPAVSHADRYISIPTPSVFDAHTSRDWTKKAVQEIRFEKTVYLDFSNTRLLASAGLAAIVKINHEVEKQNGELKLVHCADDIKRIFKIVKFDTLFSIVDRLPE